MKNEIDPNSIPDFEEQDADYQVWVFTYDDLDNIIGDNFVQSFETPEAAIFHAQELVDNPSSLKKYFKDNVAYVQVEVETVVEVEDHTENIGSLFNEFVNNPE